MHCIEIRAYTCTAAITPTARPRPRARHALRLYENRAAFGEDFYAAEYGGKAAVDEGFEGSHAQRFW